MSRNGNIKVIAIYPGGNQQAKEFLHEHFYLTIEGDQKFDIKVKFKGTNINPDLPPEITEEMKE